MLEKGKIGRRTLDITGDQYGDLFVISYYGKNQHGHPMFNTKCSCGNTQIVSSNILRMGNAKSCGCKQHMPKHGLSGTPEYHAFTDARCRCKNTNSPRYEWYGARGIKFLLNCIEDLISEIGFRPSKNHSLDRINNSGNYEIGNIRWATKSEQVNNRRYYEKPWLIGNKHALKNTA
jgi:hypothetical protein